MKQTTKRFTSTVVALILLAGAFLVFVEFIVPSYEESQKLKGEQLSRQEFVERQRQTIGQVQSLIDAYEGQGELQDAVSLALPPRGEVASALAQLNGIAQASQLAPQLFSASIAEVQNLSASAQAARRGGDALVKPIGTLMLQVKFVGAYGDLKEFLRRLETNIRIFDVRSLNIQSAGRSNQDLFTYDMTVVTYYQNP
ncbi:hypothetical protein C4587_00565 [Candidatus Parcubacteria bacterium]|nr:MAG: hypothetical protein C4587_00565 [Candidatus Parcubacteria bacterium]